MKATCTGLYNHLFLDTPSQHCNTEWPASNCVSCWVFRTEWVENKSANNARNYQIIIGTGTDIVSWSPILIQSFSISRTTSSAQSERGQVPSEPAQQDNQSPLANGFDNSLLQLYQHSRRYHAQQHVIFRCQLAQSKRTMFLLLRMSYWTTTLRSRPWSRWAIARSQSYTTAVCVRGGGISNGRHAWSRSAGRTPFLSGNRSHLSMAVARL